MIEFLLPFSGAAVVTFIALLQVREIRYLRDSRQRLRKQVQALESEVYDGLAKHREYRAAYRDLLADFADLHTAYKEQG